jgi:hypothetical protein
LAVEGLESRTLLSFAAPVAIPLGATPYAVAAGHFEGTKAPLDVVTANANGTVSVLVGNGDGTLQNPVNYTVGAVPDAVAVGDLLNNGFLDIVTANGNGSVSVFLSNGDGSFQSPLSFPVGAIPKSLAVGDVRGNGRLDIVTANANGTVSVLLGNGNGTFQSPLMTRIGEQLISVAVGHFTMDGKADIVVADLGDYPFEINGHVSVLLGNGDGTFQSPVPFFANTAPTTVAVGDVRGNGTQDIVANVNGSVRLLLGNGDGSFQKPVPVNSGGRIVTSVFVGDFTGDGKSDIGTVNFRQDYYGGNASFSLLLSNGDGSFQRARIVDAAAPTVVVAAGDFQGDGRLGLVQANGLNGVSVLLGNGNGTFASTPAYAAVGLPASVAAGDFTGSGKQDLVVTGWLRGATVLFNNGDGTFRNGPALPGGANGPVVVGDLTGNGKQDIAVSEVGTINVFLGNGDGTFQAPLSAAVAPNASVTSLLLADVTGDGRLDLVVLYVDIAQQRDFMKMLVGNGDGTFQLGEAVPLNTGSASLAVGDFFGDGKQDLVIGSAIDGVVSVLRGNGDGTFQAPIILHAGSDARAVAVGDFAGNGKQDIAIADARTATVHVLLGNGDGTFQAPITYHVGRGAALAAGDFFGDGNLSLAVDNSDLNTVSVLRGNGDGTFQDAVSYIVGAQSTHPAALIVGDFLGHGLIDLAATNFISDDVSVLLNQAHGRAASRFRQVPPAAADALFAGAHPEPVSRVARQQPAEVAVSAPFTAALADATTSRQAQQTLFSADTLAHQRKEDRAEAADTVWLVDPLLRTP